MLRAGLLRDGVFRLVEHRVDLGAILGGIPGCSPDGRLDDLGEGVAEGLGLVLEMDLVGLLLHLFVERHAHSSGSASRSVRSTWGRRGGVPGSATSLPTERKQ